MSDTTPAPGRYFTLPGMADHFGLPYLEAQRTVSAGAIPGAFKRSNGRWLIPVDAAEAYFWAGAGARRLQRRRTSPNVIEVA